MDWFLLAFVLTLVVSVQFTMLPEPALLIIAIVVLFLGYRLQRKHTSSSSKLFKNVFSIALGTLFGLLYISLRFGFEFEPHRFPDPHFPITAVLTGKITSPIITSKDKIGRFNLVVHQVNHKQVQHFSVRVSTEQSISHLKQANTVKFNAKLKPVLNYQNGFGFDYQRWALVNRLQYTAFVNGDIQLLQLNTSFRQQVLDVFLSKYYELTNLKYILALAFGVKDLITSDDYKLLNSYGIGHLFAISGLHIGVIFLFVVFIIKTVCFIFRLPISMVTRQLIGLSLIWVYVVMSGGAISTIRAAILVSLWLLISFSYSHVSRVSLFLILLFLSLLYDPFLTMSMSWWLTFSALGGIYSYLHFVPSARKNVKETPKPSLKRVIVQIKTALIKLFILQLFIFLFTAPVLIYFLAKLSISALWLNVIVVPLFVMVIIPCVFMGVVVSYFSGEFAGYLLTFSDASLSLLFDLLSVMPLSKITLQVSQLSVWLILPTVLLLANKAGGERFAKRHHFILIPRRLITVFSSIALVSMFLYFVRERNFIEVVVYDVGQGLAVAIKQKGKAILYDLGTIFPSGFNTTESVLIPNLLGDGIREVPYVAISHLDADHRGNVVKLLETYPNLKLVFCKSGSYKWQGISIDILWPDNANHTHSKVTSLKNDQSCVMKISYGNRSVLLPGDISHRIESKLIKHDKLGHTDLYADVLLSAHHGSKYSTSERWLLSVAPKYIIHSAGRYNRFNFPTKEVIQRGNNIGAKQYSTSSDGQITVRLYDNGEIKINTFKEKARPFWKSYFSG